MTEPLAAVLAEVRALRAELAAVRRELVDVRLQVARLAPLDDQAAAEALEVIHRAIGVNTTFNVAELLEHASTVRSAEALALSALLAARDALAPKRAGKLLAELAGRPRGGVVLTCVTRANRGRLWQLGVYDERKQAL